LLIAPDIAEAEGVRQRGEMLEDARRLGAGAGLPEQGGGHHVGLRREPLPHQRTAGAAGAAEDAVAPGVAVARPGAGAHRFGKIIVPRKRGRGVAGRRPPSRRAQTRRREDGGAHGGGGGAGAGHAAELSAGAARSRAAKMRQRSVSTTYRRHRAAGALLCLQDCARRLR
jgi:hypothetical protein